MSVSVSQPWHRTLVVLTINQTWLSQRIRLHWKLIMNLSVVGKTSGVYKATTENAPEIPNFPIMLNVILAGMRDTSPANVTAKLNHISLT